MRKSVSPKKSHDHETAEEDQEEIQPIRRHTGEEEEEEAELASEDREKDLDDSDGDHSMEDLDEDDLANMQGPDA